ncbi:hypothetical protein CTI14_71145, partial [Methylobacterium radiotolerans]
AKILLLAAEDSEKDIYLYINSPAARSPRAWRLYDTMQFSAKILLLAAEDSEKDIYLYINSPAARSPRAWRL